MRNICKKEAMSRCHGRGKFALSFLENVCNFTRRYLSLTNAHQTSHDVTHLPIDKAFASDTDRVHIHLSIGIFRSGGERHVKAKRRMWP